MKTGSLTCLSLSPGFVVPARSTIGEVNVNYPNRGTATPLPFLSSFAMYDPKLFQIAITDFSSRTLFAWKNLNNNMG
jgi:hypothetical protein